MELNGESTESSGGSPMTTAHHFRWTYTGDELSQVNGMALHIQTDGPGKGGGLRIDYMDIYSLPRSERPVSLIQDLFEL